MDDDTVHVHAQRERERETKYANLVDEIEVNGFTVDLITVEVGACGFVRYESFCHLNELLGSTQKRKSSTC